MENLSIIKSQNTNDDLYAMEAPLLEKYEKRGYKNPSLTLHGSMVCGFANHLPYSMDIEQPEYVPGDFLNIEPKEKLLVLFDLLTFKIGFIFYY